MGLPVCSLFHYNIENLGMGLPVCSLFHYNIENLGMGLPVCSLFHYNIVVTYPITTSSYTWTDTFWNSFGTCSVYSSPQKGSNVLNAVAVL